MATTQGLRGLGGLTTVVSDHASSWSTRTGTPGKQDRLRVGAVLYLVPTIAALVFTRWQVELETVTPLLGAVAAFTALLFGLLGVILNAGLSLRKDASQLASAHRLGRTVSDLRANTTYAILTALVLVLVLAVAAATTPPDEPLPAEWTPVLVWLASHLGLTLLMVLRRFRTAFNYITR